MRELEVKESVSLEQGNYTGEIMKVEEKIDPFEYTEVYIKEDGSGLQLRYSCPTYLSVKGGEPQSKLAILLSSFTDLNKGDKLDPGKILLGKKVSFMTKNVKRDNKEFTEIVDGTILPLKVDSKTENTKSDDKKVDKDKKDGVDDW